MIGRILKKRYAAFGERYGYDTGYLRDLVDLDRTGAFRLGLADILARHRFGLPPAPYFAARIVAARHAACGSCLKLAIDMAIEAGMALEDIRKLLLALDEAPPDMRLAARYAHAVLADDPDLPGVADDCVLRWGERGRAGLAAAVAGALFFPLFKRGLGRSDVCTPSLTRLIEPEAARDDKDADVPLA
ncbi:MAG: hypothetical protein OXF89_02440 [Rhodospirillaceae bacterium]|nr:hypothetical protein [Rhodospirillaceae bacterium]